MAHGPCHCLPLCTHQIVPRFTRPLIEFSCALNTANFTQDHRTANCVRCDGRFHFGKRFPGSCPLWCSGCTTASDRDGEQRPRDQDQDEDEDEAARCGDVYKMTNCADIATCWLSAHAATLLTEEGRGGFPGGFPSGDRFPVLDPRGPPTIVPFCVRVLTRRAPFGARVGAEPRLYLKSEAGVPGHGCSMAAWKSREIKK